MSDEGRVAAAIVEAPLGGLLFAGVVVFAVGVAVGSLISEYTNRKGP